MTDAHKTVAASSSAEGRDVRRGMAAADLKQAVLDHLSFTQARPRQLATRNDWYMSLACAVRDRMLDDWLTSLQHLHRKDVKIVSYLSAEFLKGPHLGNNLASVGSHAINGVAALHSELLKQTVLRDFFDFSPDKFLNVTNGVTPRRWMLLSNPGLARLITEKIDDGWVKNPEELRKLEALAKNRTFQAA